MRAYADRASVQRPGLRARALNAFVRTCWVGGTDASPPVVACLVGGGVDRRDVFIACRARATNRHLNGPKPETRIARAQCLALAVLCLSSLPHLLGLLICLFLVPDGKAALGLLGGLGLGCGILQGESGQALVS